MSEQPLSFFNASFFWRNYSVAMNWQKDFYSGTYWGNLTQKQKVKPSMTEKKCKKTPPSNQRQQVSRGKPVKKKSKEEEKDDDDDDDDDENFEISDEMLEFMCMRLKEKAAIKKRRRRRPPKKRKKKKTSKRKGKRSSTKVKMKSASKVKVRPGTKAKMKLLSKVEEVTAPDNDSLEQDRDMPSFPVAELMDILLMAGEASSSAGESGGSSGVELPMTLRIESPEVPLSVIPLESTLCLVSSASPNRSEEKSNSLEKKKQVLYGLNGGPDIFGREKKMNDFFDDICKNEMVEYWPEIPLKMDFDN